MSPDDLPRVASTWVSGVGVRNLMHWSQMMKAGNGLQMYDFGTDCGKEPAFKRRAFDETCNQAKYGQEDPPLYDLSNIKGVKAAIFQGAAGMGVRWGGAAVGMRHKGHRRRAWQRAYGGRQPARPMHHAVRQLPGLPCTGSLPDLPATHRATSLSITCMLTTPPPLAACQVTTTLWRQSPTWICCLRNGMPTWSTTACGTAQRERLAGDVVCGLCWARSCVHVFVRLFGVHALVTTLMCTCLQNTDALPDCLAPSLPLFRRCSTYSHMDFVW